jgi:hypothetical protein
MVGVGDAPALVDAAVTLGPGKMAAGAAALG